jgi:hypothetical protein
MDTKRSALRHLIARCAGWARRGDQEDMALGAVVYVTGLQKAVAVERLRRNAPAAIAYVRSLRDEQLQRSGTLPFGGDPMTAEAVITHVLIGHPRGHMTSIQTAAA